MAIGDIETIGLIVWSAITLNAIGNALYLLWVARQGAPPDRWPRLSVVIPARNEESNLARLLPTLTTQDYPDFEIIVYDDASEDRTAEVARALGGDRTRVLRGSGPPQGWLGKPHACHAGAEAATGDVLMFLDADGAWQHPGAIRRQVARWLALPAPAALTALPRFAGGGLLLVSVLSVALLFIPLPLAARFRWPVFGALNGQCWLMDTPTYRRLEPHRVFRAAIVEDVAIGRWLLSQGIVPYASPAAWDLTVYMYRSLGDAWQGFRKNFYFISGGSLAGFAVSWTATAALLVVAPLLSWRMLLAFLVAKFVLDRAGRLPWWMWMLAPVTGAIALAVYLDSMISWRRGKLMWKGRPVGPGSPQVRHRF